MPLRPFTCSLFNISTVDILRLTFQRLTFYPNILKACGKHKYFRDYLVVRTNDSLCFANIVLTTVLRMCIEIAGIICFVKFSIRTWLHFHEKLWFHLAGFDAGSIKNYSSLGMQFWVSFIHRKLLQTLATEPNWYFSLTFPVPL